MSDHFLLLHIGYPKTGTTTLQNFLYNNRQELLAHNWDYIDLHSLISSFDNAFNDNCQRNGQTLFSKTPESYIFNLQDSPKVTTQLFHHSFIPNAPHLDTLYEHINQSLCDRNVIISAEDILIDDYSQIISELSRHISQLRVIVYLRRQDLLIESLYGHLVKDSGVHLGDSFSTNIEIHQSYDAVLDDISHIVGTDHLIVRVYEKTQFKHLDQRQDIISDFLNVMNIHSLSNFVFPEDSNKSLTGNYLEIRRLFNKVRTTSHINFDPLSDFFWHLADSLPSTQPRGLMAKETRQSYMEKYTAGNAYVAKKYLNRPNGVLFYDTNFDVPMWDSQISSYETDLTCVIGNILYSLASKICGQNARISCIEFSQKIGKPYVFVGAGGRAHEAIEQYDMNPAFILDNDISKSGSFIGNCEIKHPSEISDWASYALIVTPERSSSMEAWLSAQGLEKNINYLTLNDILFMYF